MPDNRPALTYAEELAERGFDLYRNGDYEAALLVGRELEYLRYSAAFELQAHAFDAMGDTKEAVRVLERGVEAVPKYWRLWQTLGNYRSDLERYDAAEEALRTALACPDVDDGSVQLNIAILLSRTGDHEQALRTLDSITDEELELNVAAVRLGLLNDLGRHDETIVEAERILARTWDDGGELAWVCARLSDALRIRGLVDDAVQWAWQALQYDYRNSRALWLVRDIENAKSSNARHYRLMLEGRWYGDNRGFYITFDVVAEDPDEAFGFAGAVVDEELRGSLRIEEYEALDSCPDEPKGVYEVSSHYTFPLDSPS